MSDKMDWQKPTIIDGESISPHDWLQQHYLFYTDPETVEILNRNGLSATTYAVLRHRTNNGWIRGNAKGPTQEEKAQVKDNGPNEKEACVVRQTIVTPDELAKLAGVDESEDGEWVRERVESRSYEAPRKDEHKDLVFTGGLITGEIQSSTEVVTLHYTRVVWVRRHPVPVQPVLRPIHSVEQYKRRESPVSIKDTLHRSLLLGDAHFGFRRHLEDAALYQPLHDRRVLDIYTQMIALIQPDRIDILGDMLDMTMFTDYFLRTPEFEYTTQPSLIELHWWLKHWRQLAPSAQITLHEGNHDRRMRDQLVRHFRAGYGLRQVTDLDDWPVMSVPHLLDLASLDVNWVGHYPSDYDWLAKDLLLLHGEHYSSRPGHSAGKTIDEHNINTIQGHDHVMEMASRTVHLFDKILVVRSYSIGCACHIDGRVPAKKARPNWQQGLAVAWYEPDGYSRGVDLIPVHDGRALYLGFGFEGQNPLDELREAYPKYNWSE